MSTRLDGIFVPLAYKLLQKYGKELTLSQVARGAKNYTTGVIADGTTTTYTIKGLIMDYVAKEIDGKSVLFGDRKVLIYAQGLPTTLDETSSVYTLTISSVVWNVVSVTTAYSGEDIAYYELQVRR